MKIEETDLARQSKELQEASTKLMGTMMTLAEEKGKLEGMKLTGGIDEDKAYKEQVKVTMKAMAEVIDWVVKLSVLNMSLLQFVAQEATAED